MALNITTHPDFAGRHAPADQDYPFGASRNESAPGAGDGTPHIAPRSNDVFGLMQALLHTMGTTPSGTPDTVRNSQYVQSIAAMAAGAAYTFDEVGAAGQVWLRRASNRNLFPEMVPHMRIAFSPANDKTSATGLRASLDGIKTGQVGANATNVVPIMYYESHAPFALKPVKTMHKGKNIECVYRPDGHADGVGAFLEYCTAIVDVDDFLTPAVTALNAAIASEANTRGVDDDALNGRISSETQARQAADNALSSRVSQLSAQVNSAQYSLSLGDNGWYKFPGGLLMQWGVANAFDNTRIGFNTAFNGNPLFIMATGYESEDSVSILQRLRYDHFRASVYEHNNHDKVLNKIQWLALGRAR